MASNKVWLLKYVAGNPRLYTRVFVSEGGKPMNRQEAIDGYETIVDNTQGKWRVWVEHYRTGERIAESKAEKEWKEKV